MSHHQEAPMPIIRTAIRKGTSRKVRDGIVAGIHQALVDAIGMPEDELFNIVSEYEPEHFYYSRSFNGIARSDNLGVVEITMRRGRSDAMKTALYRNIAANLEKNAKISIKDVLIFVHENDYSDWSVGEGRFAMALVQQRGSDL
jgi:phenylpyruvate tautomerase PptA (4-oxalocrotonate tautomerase family)